MNILILGSIWLCISLSCLWLAADGGHDELP